MDMFKYFLLIKNARKNTQFRTTQSLNCVLLNFESVLNLYNFEGYKPLSLCMLQPCPWQSVPHCEQKGLQVPLHTQRDDVQLLHGGWSSHWQTLVLHSGPCQQHKCTQKQQQNWKPWHCRRMRMNGISARPAVLWSPAVPTGGNTFSRAATR